MPLRPEILAILRRTRLARLALDAQLGIIPSGIEILMATNDDNTAWSLSEADVAFLQSADNLSAALDKLKTATRLYTEARAEIRAIVGGEAPVTGGKKAKKTLDVIYKADIAEGVTDLEDNVLRALTKKPQKRSEVEAATGLKRAAVVKGLRALGKAGLAKTESRGPGAVWMRA